jgi:LmbE family N-acetylglucosaminyl deacetylase
MEVSATLSGNLSDPAIEIIAADFQDAQYLERGVQGTRFFNVSRLLSKAVGQRVHLRGHGITWKPEQARLHICREKVSAEERVVVIAPHPDDAEIAAFGLYSDTVSTVVTLTAGDGSDRFHNSRLPWISLSRNSIANARIWDSLTIPQLGGVPPERAMNLCLPDGRLEEMYLHQDRDVQSLGGSGADFAALRRMNHSPLIQDHATCTWKELVRDLGRIVADVEPTIVVVPHPGLDPHPDHLFATVALSEALQFAGSNTARIFFYTVHNHRSELWPFGPAGSGVTLLPIMPDDGNCASGFYSHTLLIDRQRQKFLALESMHDVRDIQWPQASPGWQVGVRMAAELRGLMNGMGTTPTGYLRRAVRPDEIFFVASIDEGLMLVDRAMKARE